MLFCFWSSSFANAFFIIVVFVVILYPLGGRTRVRIHLVFCLAKCVSGYRKPSLISYLHIFTNSINYSTPLLRIQLKLRSKLVSRRKWTLFLISIFLPIISSKANEGMFNGSLFIQTVYYGVSIFCWRKYEIRRLRRVHITAVVSTVEM